jgi:hypothetical protein
MRYLLLSLVFFLSIKAEAQLFTDSKPVNFYYKKIEFAHFPVPEHAKKGIIFYTADTAYFNKYVRLKTDLLLEQHIGEYYYYKFRKNRFRYTDYYYTIEKITYKKDKWSDSLTDTSYVTIYATQNRRKWSWKKFKVLLVDKQLAPVYTVKVSSNNLLALADAKNVLEFQPSNVQITIAKDQEVYDSVKQELLSGKILPVLVLNIKDAITEKHRITNAIKSEKAAVKAGSGLGTILVSATVAFREDF